MFSLSQFFSLPFLNNSQLQLNNNEKSLLLQACAFVAGSDGSANAAELSAFKKHITEIGGFHSSEIDKVFSEKVVLDGSLALGLKSLDPPKAHVILKMLFLISNADNTINDDELAAIRSIAELMMPKHSWQDIYAWILSYKMFLDNTRALFSKA